MSCVWSMLSVTSTSVSGKLAGTLMYELALPPRGIVQRRVG